MDTYPREALSSTKDSKRLANNRLWGFAVLLLHGRQQAVAERFDLLDDLGCFLDKPLETHQRQRLIEAVDNGAHVRFLR
jgi:hypothetical protein